MGVIGDTPNTATVALNYVRNAAPTASDDISAGYTVGDHWTDAATDRLYVLADHAAGAAVWVELTATAESYTDPLWDGRASLLTSVTGSTTVLSCPASSGSTVPARYSQDGSNDGCLFYTGDITLQTDTRWGKVFQVALDANSRNPFWYCTGQPANKPSAELTRRRTDHLPHNVDYYALAYKFLTPWTFGQWGPVCQLGYPTLSSPPLTLSMSTREGKTPGGCLAMLRHVGYMAATPVWTYGVNKFDDLLIDFASIQNRWLDVVVGVEWSADADGWITVDLRVDEGSWSRVYDQTGIATYQQFTGQSWKSSVLDKHGAYQDAAGFAAGWENVSLQTGIMRFADEASAKHALGGTGTPGTP